MSRFFLPICLLLLFSCGSENGDPLLRQPPYAALTDSIDRNPEQADLYYRRGSLLYSGNQPALAQQDLERAWSLEPSEEYALSITTLLQAKSTDSALVFLQQAIAKLPNSIALQVGLARGYQQKGQLPQATTLTRRVLDRFPNQIDALLLQSELLKAQGKPDSALASLEKAYEYAPFDADLTHTLAFEYAEQGNRKALALSDSLVAADQQQVHAEPYYFKGIYYSNTGNPAEAIRQFDLAIRRNYNFINAYVNKAITQYEGKDYANALKTLELAATVEPAEPDIYYWMGKTKEAQGNREAARQDYQRAYGLDKNFTEARDAAARL